MMTTQPPGRHTRSISARPASPPCPGAGVKAEQATTRPAESSGSGSWSKNPRTTRTRSPWPACASLRRRIRRIGSAGSTATTCCPCSMSSMVSRPVPAPTSAIRSTSRGSQPSTPGWSRSALASRSYSSGSSRYSSSQARTTSWPGSPSPRGTNRRASSRVNTLMSSGVYRLRSSRPGPFGTCDGLSRPGPSGLLTDLSPVLVRLPDPDRPQQPVGKLRLEPLPDGLGQVLRGRDEPLQPRDVGVQVAVIHVPDDLPADDVRQQLQVQDVAAGLVDLAGYDHLQDIVVAMQVRAFSEQPPVLLIGQVRIAQLVRGTERFTAADQNSHQPRPLLAGSANVGSTALLPRPAAADRQPRGAGVPVAGTENGLDRKSVV